MSALKEFADFIILNMANLAATYAQLLAESNAGYEIFPADSRITSARKLLKAVIEAYESQTPDPLVSLFDAHTNENFRRWAEYIDPPHPLAEIECLGQTLTPVVTSLEAGKFLWDILLDLRTTVYQPAENKPVFSVTSAIHGETDKMALPHKAEDKPGQEPLPGDETRFRKIFDLSNDAIFVVDPVQDKILDINRKACSMLGYTREELLSLSFSAIHTHQLPELMAFAQSVVEQRHGRTNELSCMTKSGYVVPVEVSASIIELDGNSSLVALVRDISERKQVEELSQESEERYRLLLDSSPEPIVTYDNKGQAMYINSAFTQTFGWSEDELLGKRVDFVPEESWPETKAALERLAAEGKILGFETKRLTKDGRILDVQQSGALIRDKDGNPTGSIIFIRDITELKTVQETTQQQARREQTIREITEKMRTATTLDELVKTTAEELGERLSAGHAVVQLGIDVNKNT